MSAETELAENQITGDKLGELLAGAVRLVNGAVAAAFIPRSTDHSPVVWSDLAHADVATGLHELALERFEGQGPWGPASRESWTAWVEPLNDLAGLTLVVIATCQECGQLFPASPRMRVYRCSSCREVVRQRRHQKARHEKGPEHGSSADQADARSKAKVIDEIINERDD